MRSKIFLFIPLLLASSMAFASAKEKLSQPVSPACVAQAQPTPNQQPLTAEQSQGLKDDLARMKALVQQMETNLAFVDTTQSPLKHQFQLEIDMWRTMIRQMERRLGQEPGSKTYR
jgi:hypothetical protein